MRLRKKWLCAIIFGLLWGTAAWGQQSPAIFFSDLESGPNTGGKDNKGAIVTIYGKGFGASRGSSKVTIGCGDADNYIIWSDTKIAFQLGPLAKSGNILVHVPNVGISNGVPFTVRSGNIYFVSTSGSDSAAGSYTAPWRTIVKAKDSIAPGDIAYIMDGVSQTGSDNYAASLCITSAGTGNPKALVAYPGAAVTIGTNTSSYGIRTPMISGGPFSNWVIAGMTIRGYTGVDLYQVDNWRFVNNEITCPSGGGPTACFHTDRTTNLKFLGNYVHDTGTNCGSDCKLYHAVYLSTNSNYIDIGWNTVVPKGGCRGIQFHSTGGADQYGLKVHDNVIYDTVCDGLNFASVNPDAGAVEAYNNLIYNAGKGPDPSGEPSNYAAIMIDSFTSHTGGGVAKIYNNTLYNNGTRGGADAGVFQLSIPTRLTNNIVRQLTGSYFTPNSGCSKVSGSNNIFYGVTMPSCSGLSNTINSDPKFVDPAAANFRLQVGSPAIGAGVDLGLLVDKDGVPRPVGQASTLGAYEYPSATAPTKPYPPTELKATAQ